MGGTGFTDQFRWVVVRHKRVGCSLNVIRRSSCLVVGPVAVADFAALFGCAPMGRASLYMIAPTWGFSFWLVGTGALRLLLGPPGLN